MKKLISVTLVLTMILTMCSCVAKKEEGSGEAANSEAISSETATTESTNSETAESTTEEINSESANTDTSIEEIAGPPLVIGELTFINADVDMLKKYEVARLINIYAREEIGASSSKRSHDHKKIADTTVEDLNGLYNHVDVKMFDSLTAMTMALEAGDIRCMTLYDSVANYICANNSDLEVEETCNYDYDAIAYEDGSILYLTRGDSSDEFTFMMLEGNEALRDEFNSAIADIKKDGTLTELTKKYITEADFSSEIPASPEFESFDGADTIKVGVTGDLPPFDYMTEAGEPEGFNKVILAEIGKRIGKNIELVSIDSGSRAIALSSGQIDVVFWTRSQSRNGNINNTSNDASTNVSRKELTHEEFVEEMEKLNLTTEDAEIIAKARDLSREFLNDEFHPRALDTPDGTINTDYFYSAPIVHVRKKIQ